jgi:hypothetical protein
VQRIHRPGPVFKVLREIAHIQQAARELQVIALRRRGHQYSQLQRCTRQISDCCKFARQLANHFVGLGLLLQQLANIGLFLRPCQALSSALSVLRFIVEYFLPACAGDQECSAVRQHFRHGSSAEAAGKEKGVAR